MTLAPGSRLGVYEVTALIGRGGMGEVYRAHDPRLDRDVAIKVLPESTDSSPESAVRFEREARVLASLNHPHIAAIYGLEETRGPEGSPIRALVLELVAGPTLAERLAPDLCHSRTRCGWRVRSPTRSRPRTRGASFIAI